ncbi:MAG: DUF1559 domain-containing protein [Thermoguttaceae bacterium]
MSILDSERFVCTECKDSIGKCVNNIERVMLALRNYHDLVNALPPLYTVDTSGKPLHSWRVFILPYIEEATLYGRIRLNESWDSEYNKQFHAKMPAIFRCPSNLNTSSSNQACCYAALSGKVFVPAKNAGDKVGVGVGVVGDSTSNIPLIVEVREPFCWMAPTADVTLDDLAEGINTGRVGSFHAGGCHIGLLDGSIKFITSAMDRAALLALGDGGK